MAILVRTGEGNWIEAERKIFAKERHLQDLLLRSPELIETTDGSRLLLTEEAGLSGGTAADLLGVTSSGEILIVEAKLASNPEIRRKIIGQIFEYGARLWGAEFSVLDGFFHKRLGKSLAQVFAEDDTEFDGNEFRKKVEQNLKSGKFHLLIAVDEMNEELETILSYISSCGKGFRLEALAVRLYESGAIQILAPQRYGQIGTATPEDEGMTVKATAQDIIANSTSAEMQEKMQAIADLWREAGHFVFAAKVGLSLRIGLPSKVVTMFWATPNDVWGIQPNFISMQQHGMPGDLLTQLRQNLGTIEGFAAERMLYSQNPVTKFSAVSLENVRRFVGLMIDTAAKWRESLQT